MSQYVETCCNLPQQGRIRVWNDGKGIPIQLPRPYIDRIFALLPYETRNLLCIWGTRNTKSLFQNWSLVTCWQVTIMMILKDSGMQMDLRKGSRISWVPHNIMLPVCVSSAAQDLRLWLLSPTSALSLSDWLVGYHWELSSIRYSKMFSRPVDFDPRKSHRRSQRLWRKIDECVQQDAWLAKSTRPQMGSCFEGFGFLAHFGAFSVIVSYWQVARKVNVFHHVSEEVCHRDCRHGNLACERTRFALIWSDLLQHGLLLLAFTIWRMAGASLRLNAWSKSCWKGIWSANYFPSSLLPGGGKKYKQEWTNNMSLSLNYRSSKPTCVLQYLRSWVRHGETFGSKCLAKDSTIKIPWVHVCVFRLTLAFRVQIYTMKPLSKREGELWGKKGKPNVTKLAGSILWLVAMHSWEVTICDHPRETSQLPHVAVELSWSEGISGQFLHFCWVLAGPPAAVSFQLSICCVMLSLHVITVQDSSLWLQGLGKVWDEGTWGHLGLWDMDGHGTTVEWSWGFLRLEKCFEQYIYELYFVICQSICWNRFWSYAIVPPCSTIRRLTLLRWWCDGSTILQVRAILKGLNLYMWDLICIFIYGIGFYL